MRRQASLAADPIRGAAQNLVGRGKARSVGYADVGKLGLLQWLVRGRSDLFDDVRTPLRPNRLTGEPDQICQ